MAAPTRTPREAWIEAGLRALAAGGPEAVRIDVLARALGVTRGGFYWHFADRAALLAELLDAWERRDVDDVIVEVEQAGGDGRERLRRLAALANGDVRPLDVDLAVRDWARRDPEVAARLARVDDRRIDYMRELFLGFCDDPAEAEARALTAFALWIGNHFIAATHGDSSRAEVLERALGRLVA